MTDKERAQERRALANELRAQRNYLGADYLDRSADRLDPSGSDIPTPGTSVWWQDTEGLSDPALGQVNEFGYIEMFGTSKGLDMDEVKWWPARTVEPGSVVLPLAAAKQIKHYVAGEGEIYDQLRDAIALAEQEVSE